jgi:hypothetical protein
MGKEEKMKLIRISYLIFALFPFIYSGILSVAYATPIEQKFAKVPVQIDVLKGVSVTDDDIQKMIEEANRVLKQTNIQLEFDKKKNIQRDWKDQGNNNNKIETGEDNKLDEAAQKEINAKFGAGKGIKIVITDEIHGDTNTNGLAPHAKKPKVCPAGSDLLIAILCGGVMVRLDYGP